MRLFLVLFIFSFSAFALEIPITGANCSGGKSTPEQYCLSAAANLLGGWSYQDTVINSVSAIGTVTFACRKQNLPAGSHNSPMGGGTCTNHPPRCPAPAVWDAIYSHCIQNACPSGQYYNSSNVCVPEPVCAVGKYVDKTNATNHVCTDIPDCNPGLVTGYWFDMDTAQCVTGGEMTICISGTYAGAPLNTFYCPPATDCKPRGYICSNDPITVAIAQEDKAATIAADQARADAAAAQAAQKNTEAQTAKTAIQAQRDAAIAAVNAAKNTLDVLAASASATTAQKSAAAQDYGNALTALAAANARLDAATTAGGAVAGAAGTASDFAGAVPGSATSDHADYNRDGAEAQLGILLGALADALTGGSGSGSGTGTGTDPVDDTGKATEATLQQVRDALTSDTALGTYTSPPEFTTENKGDFEQSKQDANDEIEASRQVLSDKMTEIKDSITSIFSESVTSGVAELPSLDLGTYKGVHVAVDFNDYAAQFSIVAMLILAFAYLDALAIILSGKK